MHFLYHEGQPYEWPNLEFRAPLRPNRAMDDLVIKKVTELTQGLRSIDIVRRAVARHSDPDTSWAAARSLGDLTESQAQVFAILHEHGPLMDYEIEQHARKMGSTQTPSGLRSRRGELVEAGLVEWTGRKGVKPDTGNESRIWAAREI